jgi:hypothetical protein
MFVRSIRAVLVAALATGALTAGALPAQAQPDQPDRNVTYRVVPYVIADQRYVGHPDVLIKEVREHGNLDRLGISPATADGPSRITRPTSAAAEPTNYVVDSSRFPGGRIPDDSYDYAKREECDANPATSNDAGWIKNRFSYCQRQQLFMPAFECTIIPWRCTLVGTYTSTNTLIGYGKAGGHEDWPSFRWADFRLSVENIIATGPFARSGAELSAAIECDGDYHDNPQFNDREACYPDENTETEKSIGDWKRDGAAHFDLASQALPPDPHWGEQIATGVFHIEYEFSLPWFFQFIDTESPEGGMRFDSAWYLQSNKLGSVFDRSVPGMSYTKADAAVTGVAEHLEQARANPAATLPAQPDKHLAGGSPADPLHRLPGTAGVGDERYNDNRRIVSNYCATKEMQDLKATLPVDQGPYDCDEYAFASTYEGAGRFLYPKPGGSPQFERHYSVRWVNSTVNQEAGRRLGRWYDNDRLLDNDAFYVPIR